MAELSALLEQEASSEIETIISEAQSRASEMIANAKTEVETLTASHARAAKAQGEAALVRAKSAAQLEASALRLRAQHDGVESVFAAARDKLDKLLSDPEEYAPVFSKLLSEAVAAAGTQSLQAVIVGPQDRELAEKAVAAAGLTVPVETAADVKGGMRLRTANRSVIANTLYGRLEALRGELASEVSTALFGAKAG
ncbi:MAG: V-type ATP synthase subunit E [Truepera sp.]|nr:V-type ATP synthase subunit E [Truepera sp.]HRQ10388.1 V-type ATP synthase subunit E [Trueperaceae bacterium]